MQHVARNDSTGIPNDKTGTVWTTSLHVFTAIVGAAILALPKVLSWLGWVAGPILLWIFFAISLLASRMLSSCYESDGVEHARYHHAVRHLLGRRNAFVVSMFQLINIFLMMITFTITGSDAMMRIGYWACSYEGKTEEENLNDPSCLSSSTGGQWKMALVFGGLELFLSQVENLEEAWWISLLGSLASVVYVLIVLIIALANSGNGGGSVTGITTATECEINTSTGVEYETISTADKVFGVLNALGSIAFSFNFSLILLEIQDTLKQPPSAVKQMKKTCNIAISLSFCCYFLVAVSGYAAEGNCVDSIILNSFTGPGWALIIAYLSVLVHMLMAYQVFGQAIFDTIESQVKYALLKRHARKEQKLLQDEDSFEQADEEGDTVPSLHKKSKKHKVRKAVGGIPTPFDSEATADRLHSVEGLDHRWSSNLGFEHSKLPALNDRVSASLSTQITDPQLSSILHGVHSYDSTEHRRKPSGLRSMYSVDTGFANEQVPLNNEGYVIPWYYRLVLRSSFVLLITLLACVLPFFEAMAGLSGSITFFPLAIYFPFACYRTLYPVSRRFDIVLKMIWMFTLSIGIIATVGAFRNVIVSWSQYKIFG
jgi:amino acid permease